MNEAYSPWVKKLILQGLYSTGNEPPWMDHELLIHKERKGQMLGSLEREVILDMRDKWIPMAAPYLENPAVSDGDRKKLEKDMHAVKWAGICADRYVDYVAQEEWRNAHPSSSTIATSEKVAMDTQANPFVPDAPLEGSPASGENDETKRGPTLEPNEKDLGLQFAQLKAQVTELEIGGQSQQSPAPPPIAPLGTRALDSSEAEELSTSNGDQPVSIERAIGLLAQLEEKALAEASTWQELKRGMAAAGKLVDLIREGLGKAEASRELVEYSLDVWLTYLDRVGGMLEEAKGKHLIADVGRRRDQEKPTLEGMGITKRLAQYIRQLRSVGLEQAKTELRKLDRLTKTAVFNQLGDPNKKGSSRTHKNSGQTDQHDPRRFFLSFICDLRSNPSFYSPINAAKLLDDPRILENLDPIEEIYVNFSIAIIGALRAKRALENVPRETNAAKSG